MRVMERVERKDRGAGVREYRTPWVQIVGAIVAAAGFAVGDEIVARAERGRIVLERAKPGRNGAKEKIGRRATTGA